MNERELSFVDIVSILVRWRKFIISNLLIVLILSAAISLVLPKWYAAKTTLLSPTDEGVSFGLSAILNNLPISGFGSGTTALSTETNIFLAILNSRTVLESVARKFNLQEVYKTENMEFTIKALTRHFSIEINEDGTLTLRAEARTPLFATKEEIRKTKELARDLAIFFVEELDRVNKQLKGEKARNTRIFIEKRYNQNLEDLRSAEEAFKEFQQRNETISLPDQTKALIEAVAELKARILSKEIEAEIMSKYVNSSHTEITKIQNELESLKDKYSEFQHGAKSKKDNGHSEGISKDIFIPIEDLPDIGLQYARLFRELVLQEKILEFLLPQYEQAKIQEAKDTPTVQVLDPAVTPENKSRPKRAIIVSVAGLFALFISIVIAMLAERLSILKGNDRQQYDKIINIWSSIRGDLCWLHRRK
jgi:tyrosine-protein kinase Etk/Wzc